MRKTEDLYCFNYLGKPAAVRHEDVRFGPDRYYFSINEKDRLKGTLTSDDGERITVGSWTDEASSKYSIRENK